MDEMNRRRFLASVGFASIGLTTPTTAQTDYSWTDGGDVIDRSYPEDELRRHVPYLTTSRTARESFIGLYGWKAESPDRDTDVYAYWARYTHQTPGIGDIGLMDWAVGAFASDGHVWDHEPSYVFVDSETGNFELAVVTGYHHFPLFVSSQSPPITRADDGGQHLHLKVVDPWHHYLLDNDTIGGDPTIYGRLESFLDVRGEWDQNGVFDATNNLAIDNPWAFPDNRVDSWWDESTRDAKAARWWAWLGLRGADEASPAALPE
ncbi:hypothetical protein [Natronosalvus rutilus]|uniref:Uncharacterized protein n=1 Tax=Natronosalvus rutilus TaxID=2953753 RepID=A0A9E7N9G8_9EURY|nr:hypothetical protein [Natronosalvus rutilus]UTF52745.1 hypothetical protein NGM29_13260 [Natronosalvus rutilus]